MKIGSVVTPEWKSCVLGRVSIVLLPILVAYAALGPGIPKAVAQESSVRDTAAARALFEEGVACADAGDWACAADRFERAHALRPSPVIAYNLGHALVELGRLVEGTEILGRLMRDEQVPEAVRRDAAHVTAQAEPRIGRLSVHVEGPLEALRVTVDGVELASSLIGTAAPVDPGAHEVEASRGGEVVARGRVDIAPGASGRVDLSIPPLPPEPAAGAVGVPAPEEVALTAVRGPGAPDAGGGDDGPWIALGITGALLVVGGAIVLAVVLSTPAEEEMPFDGNLGHVELGP